MDGKLVVFSAPSGSGKTTLVHHLLDAGLPLEFSISAASRSIRGKEVHGKDYYFHSVDEFKKKIKNNDFVEWEEVYQDHFYGTLKSELQRIWDKGKHIIFDVDVVGGLNIKKQFGDKALAVFVQPPSIEELESRLRGRGTEDEESLKKRLDKAAYEMTFADQFDVVIVNNDLDTAKKQIFDVVSDFLNS